jgi:hypothetical protein
MTDHPITPPPELVQQWADEAMKGWRDNGIYERDIAAQAARWGADQELEACCEWLKGTAHIGIDFELLNARRPKPPSKDEALDQLVLSFDRGYLKKEAADTIRRALEQLDD